MKRKIALTLGFMMIFPIIMGCVAATPESAGNLRPPEDLPAAYEPMTVPMENFPLFVKAYSREVVFSAAQHLKKTQETLYDPDILDLMGFSADELSGMRLGSPFSILVYDEINHVIFSQTLSFPLLYSGNIIGIIETAYDGISASDHFTFGRSYGDVLNELKHHRQFEIDEMLIIGSFNLTLFATNGEYSVILMERPGRPEVTIDQLNEAAPLFASAAGWD